MTASPDVPRLEIIPISSINLNPNNPRGPNVRDTDPGFSYLKQSIRERGILVPLVVKKENGTYFLIDGERRFHAARELGLEDVPAHVLRAEMDVEAIQSTVFHIHMNWRPWTPAQELHASEALYSRLVGELGGPEEAGLLDAYVNFHSFHNFLLGCVAIDALYDEFGAWFREVFPPSGIPIEYVWLLTALFHDVGYAIQKGPDVDAVLYGMDRRVDLGSGKSSDVMPEYETSRRMEFWNSFDYRWHRRQLVGMFEHLTAPTATSDWAPNAFLGDDVPESEFDGAMEDSFMSPDSHGAASALLLLRAISKKYASDLPMAVKVVVQKSMYVAAVSIPIHDWHFRDFLASKGIGSISSKRFPLAALLAYIDSIQDDRREFGDVFPADVLEELEVEGDGTVVAGIAVDRIPPDQLAGKQTEAQGVVDYIVQDGLRFKYPREFLSEE